MNDSFFSYDGTFYNTLNRIADLIILNVIWLLCCIPVVTIGASTTAMLYVTMKMASGEDAYIVRKFFKSFKENFLQSTVIWLIMAAIAALLIGNYVLLPNMQVSDSLYNLFFSASCLTALLYAMIIVWIFPLQARLENKIRHTFKNALLLSFRHLPTTLLLMVIVFVPMFLIWNFFSKLFYVVVLIAGSGLGLLCSLLYNRIFNIYIKPEEVEEGESEEELLEDEERLD